MSRGVRAVWYSEAPGRDRHLDHVHGGRVVTDCGSGFGAHKAVRDELDGVPERACAACWTGGRDEPDRDVGLVDPGLALSRRPGPWLPPRWRVPGRVRPPADEGHRVARRARRSAV